MTADKRKPIEDQIRGMSEELERGRMEEEIPKKSEPQCKKFHRDLKNGERCKDCGFFKF